MSIWGCLPPLGGSGLKFYVPLPIAHPQQSLPPLGGSGLKYWAALSFLYRQSLPPLGGSGLKYLLLGGIKNAPQVSLLLEGVD